MKFFCYLNIFLCLIFSQEIIYSKTIFFNNPDSRLNCFNYVSGLGDYTEIATQQQLNQYGTIYDLVTLPDGTYVAIFSGKPVNKISYRQNNNFLDDNNNIYLYKLDANFNVIWNHLVASINFSEYEYGISYDFFINDQDQMFSCVFGIQPESNAPLFLVNLKDGSNTYFILDNTAASWWFHIQFIDAEHIVFICETSREIRIYNLKDETYILNPDYVMNLRDYLSKMCIKDFSVDCQTNMWFFRFVDDIAAPKFMQTAIYSIDSGNFLKLFSSEPYENLFEVSMKFSNDMQSLILLANSSSYKYYLFSGKNNLICKNYSLVKGSIIPFLISSQYWSLGNSGKYFLWKNNGLYEI